MLIKQDAGIRRFKKSYIRLFLLLCVGFIYHSQTLYGNDTIRNDLFKNLEAAKTKKLNPVQFDKQPLVYYLSISDFAESFIEIPTSNVSSESPTISSKYLAGRAALYNQANQKVGTCSASFLCMQNADGIYTDISNYISVDSGLIVTWFTPTTLINLELDSIIHSMVTECIVVASTKVGFNPFYGQTFDLVVSSDDQKIYFQFTRTGAIF
jgi:hypothetical protein